MGNNSSLIKIVLGMDGELKDSGCPDPSKRVGLKLKIIGIINMWLKLRIP